MTSGTTITCLCGAVSAPGTLLVESERSIKVHCHCSSCRYTSGSLGITWPVLHSSPSQEVLSKLTAYHSSNSVTRYFCSTCGCHCFVEDHRYDESVWYCLGGNIEPGETDDTWKNAIKIMRHDFVLDTVDGGLVPLLLNLDGRNIPARAAQGIGECTDSDLTETTILSMSTKAMTDISSPDESSYLVAKCHCEGISMVIKRASYGADETARYISSDRTKYQTYMCACRSCRLSTGVSLVPWTTLPASNVFRDRNTLKPVPFSPDQENEEPYDDSGSSLKHYRSSKKVWRTFCDKCGATISYWSAERPTEVDLVVGIFRAEEGSLARKWLEWEWGRCSFEEEATDEPMMSAWKDCEKIMKPLDEQKDP